MRVKFWILGVLSIVVVVLAAVLPPIAQPVSYHAFVDQRDFWGIPNFWNVVSNLGFLLIGVAGIVLIERSFKSGRHQSFVSRAERWPYLILFFSVAMVCVGSAYYHWMPNNMGLLWDRLPIACGVTALLAATIVDRVGVKAGLIALPILVFLGVASVLHWYWSELQGAGNLNFYIVVQFYSLLLVVVLSVLLPSRYTRGADIYTVVGLYGLSKVTEKLDGDIYALGQVVSGHTLKHLIAAFAVYWIVRMLMKRVPVAAEKGSLK